MRLYFATDIHGSETCWRKFLNAGQHYKRRRDRARRRHDGQGARPGDQRRRRPLARDAAREPLRADDRGGGRRVRGRGDPPRLLPVPHRPGRAPRAARGRAALARALPREDARDGREVDGASPTSGSPAPACACFCCPGNDDQFEVDEVIEQAKHVELGEGRVVDIDGFQMASTGWANRTPWDTYREEDEPDLQGAHRQGDRAGDGAGREDGLQLPLPAVPLGPRRRTRADGGHDAEGRRPRREAGRLDRGARGDRGAPAGALAARPHPRGPRQLPHRPNALH